MTVYPPALAARAVGNLEAFYGFCAEGDGTYEDLAAHAAAAGVRGFLFFSVATTPHQVPKINDTIAALVARSQKEDGFLAAGFAAMHPDFPDMEKELDRSPLTTPGCAAFAPCFPSAGCRFISTWATAAPNTATARPPAFAA